MKQFQGTPYYVYISLSNFCNANCVFCDVHEQRYKQGHVDVEVLLDELQSLGTKYIHFIGGGEPLINKDIWKYFGKITNLGMKFAITTNGFYLDDRKISELANYNLNHIFFSIDGHTAEIHDQIRRVPGLWKRATENIVSLKKAIPKAKIVINHVLNKNNIDFFSNMLQLKDQIPFDFFNPLLIKDCPELEMTNQQIEKYNNSLKDYEKLSVEQHVEFLYDGINFFGIDENLDGMTKKRWENTNFKCYYPQYASYIDCPTASVYPCDCTIHRSPKLFNCGNLNEKTFTEIWNDVPMQNLRHKLEHQYMICKKNCDRANVLFNRTIEEVMLLT